jgi:hypothetical protein
MLSALGVLDPGVSLAEVWSDHVGDSATGYYTPGSTTLVVAADPDRPLDAWDLTVVTHELVHALTSQRIGMARARLARPDDPDAQLAALSLEEGDAEIVWRRAALRADGWTEDLAAPTAPAEAPAVEVPHLLARRLAFPYTAGLGFVCRLLDEGGWAAVDAAYRRPPATSAEILFPDRPASRELRAPDVSGPGKTWERVRRQTWGAADLMFLLEAPGDDRGRALDRPLERAGAWGAGEILQWRSGGRAALALALREHPRHRGPDLCDTMARWYRAAFPGDSHRRSRHKQVSVGARQHAVITCAGDAVILGIGPDAATAHSAARAPRTDPKA